MRVNGEQIRAYRLEAHGLHQKAPMDGMLQAAGACGLQNTPPGAWQTALFNRLEGCTLTALEDALYRDKTLLQAWSIRGVPLVFPTAQSDVFLTPLVARPGEEPWIYTRGIGLALDHLAMSFEDLLARTKKATGYLDSHTVKSKQALDATLADIILADLPGDKRALWQDPTMYGDPDKQTVGGAAVSFLLRPCSFYSLVVFGQRQGASPTFTSYKSWVGHPPANVPEADKALARKFLRCYGPTTQEAFMHWLGCAKPGAKRLWDGVKEEMAEVLVEGKPRYLLAADVNRLEHAACDRDRLLLLGAHDPYLDQRDRATLLADKTLQRQVWQTVANPGAVVKGGRVIGIWRVKTLKDKMDISINLWEKPSQGEKEALRQHAEEYAAFRQMKIRSLTM